MFAPHPAKELLLAARDSRSLRFALDDPDIQTGYLQNPLLEDARR